MQPVSEISYTRRYRRLLSSILLVSLVVAVALRFVGIGFGQGALDARPDEELLRSASLLSLRGDLNPHYAVWGHLFHYLYVAVGAVYLTWGVCIGWYASWTDALAAAHCAPAAFEMLGRAISATAGTLTLLATYRLARNSLKSRLTAACSCIVLCTLFLHVRDSHFSTSDVLLTLNCTAALAAMSGPTKGRAGRAGIWTGLALATKFLAVTVIATYFTAIVWQRLKKSEPADERPPFPAFGAFLLIAGVTALVLQPFLILDPMETYFGLWGDLFNPERRPFEGGLNLLNLSIIVRYYVPQAMGWLVGIVAVAGGVHMAFRGRSRRRWVLIVFACWSLLALLSVQRIFLRYLDPLLPIASIFVGHAIVAAGRWFAAGKARMLTGLAAAVVVAAPNLVRDLWLDHRLLQPDTRALAGRWIESHVPPGSRILWSGFGHTPPHLTMPRLFTPDAHDEKHLELRSSRGLNTDVDRAIERWKGEHAVSRYSLVSLSIGSNQPEQSTLDYFPMVDHHYDVAWLKALDRWSRRAGLLRRETPRVDLVHRHVTSVVSTDLTDLANCEEDYLVITGMPADPNALLVVRQRYEEVQRFSPGAAAATMYEEGSYDQGDAWFLPNRGIHRVDRGGVEIHIFRRRT